MGVDVLQRINNKYTIFKRGDAVKYLAIVLSTADSKPSMGSFPIIFPRATFQWISTIKPCNHATHETKPVALARPLLML